MLISLLIERLQMFSTLHDTKDITDSELVALVTENMDRPFVLTPIKRGIYATNSFTESKDPAVPPTFVKEVYVPYTSTHKTWLMFETKNIQLDLKTEQTWLDAHVTQSFLQLQGTESVLKNNWFNGGIQGVSIHNSTEENYNKIRGVLEPLMLLPKFSAPSITISSTDAEIQLRTMNSSNIRIDGASTQALHVSDIKTRTYDIRNVTSEPSPNKYKPYVSILLDRFILSDGTNLPFIRLDGIDSGILQEHTLGNTTVRRVLTKDLEERYTVTAGAITAHGFTLADAQKSLRWKIETQLAGFNFDVAIKLLNKGTITVADYRELTGACEAGVNDFRKRHNITVTEMTLDEVNAILTTNDYGYSKFHNLYALYNPEIKDWTVEKIKNKFI